MAPRRAAGWSYGAVRDGELEAIAAELRGEGADYAQVMSAKGQNLRYFASYSLSKDRMPDGKARR